MWTYFLIFLAVCALVTVFARRVILYFRKDKDVAKDEPEKATLLNEELPETLPVSKGNKQTAEAYFQKGEQMLKAGKEDEAIQCFVQALTINPGHMETMQKLAMLYMQKEMFGGAAALFKQMGDLTDDAVHFSHMGLALFNQSDFEGAKEAYQKAVSLDETRPQRFVSLSQVYRALSLPGLAIIALNKAIEKEEENVDFLLLMADLLIDIGNREGAAAVLKKAIVLDEENQEAKKLLKELEGAEGLI